MVLYQAEKGFNALVNRLVSGELSNNPNIFREYRYLIGGQGGSLTAFTKYQLKIVMRSTNQALVPRFQALRSIALSV